MVDFKPGGDQAAISRIANELYGGYPQMFDALGWEWVGSQVMTHSASLAKEHYGSIKQFVKAHKSQPHIVSLFENYSTPNVLITSMRSWEPELRGGWNIHGEPSRQAIIDKTDKTFLLVVYMAKRPNQESLDVADVVMGFLEVTHEKAQRVDLDSAEARHSSGNAEAYSLRATRAFEFLPKHRPMVLDIVPDLRTAYPDMIRDLNKGIALTENQLEKLSAIPYREVSLFGSEDNFQDTFFGVSSMESLANFSEDELGAPLTHILAEPEPNVWLTSFYGWDPEEWGCAGFSAANQADTFEKTTKPGVLLVVYGAKSSRTPKHLKGKVLGIYQMSHKRGESAQWLSPGSIVRNERNGFEDKWTHAFKCERAWSINPASRPDIEELAPETYAKGGHQFLGSQGRRLSRLEAQNLLKYAWFEESVYLGRSKTSDEPSEFFTSQQGPIAKHPGRSDKNPDGPRDLYVLRLNGDVANILGICPDQVKGHHVIKAGLAKNAQRRCDTLNKAIPGNEYYWELVSSTSVDFGWKFPNGEIAKTNERELQFLLQEAKDAMPLGGEFFRVHPEDIENAWSRLHRKYAIDGELHRVEENG